MNKTIVTSYIVLYCAWIKDNRIKSKAAGQVYYDQTRKQVITQLT